MKRSALDIVVTVIAAATLTWFFACAGTAGTGWNLHREDVASTASVGTVVEEVVATAEAPDPVVPEVVAKAEALPGLIEEVVVVAKRPAIAGLPVVDAGNPSARGGSRERNRAFRN
ncbi:MAG: hypothetical protein JSU73_07230 [candidate division WOR-3 bacterium]|nr:MAG: hypothetical protein JSU73_07230 [candidate division WOR-3 bacterium]